MKKNYKTLIGILLCVSVSFLTGIKIQQRSVNMWKKDAQKNRALFLLMNQWMCEKQEGKNLKTYFEKNGYKKIAVYGMSYVGMRLVKELKDSGIEVAYGIDRNAENIYADVKVITMRNVFENVDAIVITTLTEFDNICRVLSEKLDCPFISIEDIVNEI